LIGQEGELTLDSVEQENKNIYPPGHTLLIYFDDNDLISYLLPIIKTNLSRDGMSLIFTRGDLARFLRDEVGRECTEPREPGILKIFSPEDGNGSVFRRKLLESNGGGRREILAIREIPYWYSPRDILKEERSYEDLLNSIPAIIICLMRENALKPRSRLTALSVHPWLVIRGVLCDNFYHVNDAQHRDNPEALWRYRLDTLQLQGLLRQEIVGRQEASSREMQARIQELSILHSLSSAAARTFDIDALSAEALPILGDFLEMDAGTIHYPDEKKHGRNALWARSEASREALKLFDRHGVLTARCIQNNRPIWSDTMDCREIGIDLPEPFNSFSFLIAPMILRDGTVGVVKFISLSAVEITPEKVELARAAASQIGIGAENSRLYHEVLSAKREWEGTFNSVSDMILVRDNNFKTLRYNHALALRYNLKKLEMAGTECYRLLFGRSTPCPQCSPVKENQEWDMPESLEFRESRICRHRVFSLRNDEGSLIGAIHIARDVTDEERLRQQLYHADKMAALGQMISGIAHEVNNPLTGILGFTEILLEQKPDKKDLEFVEKINIEAHRAAQIMKGLLTFARDYSPRREATDLCEILSECLTMRDHDLHLKNIHIIKDFRDIPKTTADPNQMRQVFMNLLTNAEHAILDSSGQGTIMVHVSRNDGSLEVKISDDGPGVPPEKVTRIFEPFYTTKEPGKGTGLGLAISHAIVAEHKGTIHVEKSSLGGASFIVCLPLVNPPPQVAAKKLSEREPDYMARILVIDDEASLRRIIELAMKKEGHEVRTSSNALDALRIYREETFDLLILDMKMPGMGGIELCRHLPRPLPPVLVISGDTLSDEIQSFAQETGADFLPKPFTIGEITDSVRRNLKKRKNLSPGVEVWRQ
jgi:signal transduction histidine kinase/CheY-like chemotaxis protein/GAF domain-containing protein